MRVYLETFGCQMNELDSELVRGQLESLGYTFCATDQDAQVVLYNTCSVREHAEQKAYSRIGRIGGRKKDGEQLILGVLGCMAERDGLDLFRRHPQVDILCGPGELDKLPQLIDNARRTMDVEDPVLRAPRERRVALAGNTSRRVATLGAAQDGLEALDLARAFEPREGTPSHTAYVRITRGCNKFCTYCVVPYTRGAEVHRPPDHIVDECRRLVDAGVLEITLLGQTVNHYRYVHGLALTVSGAEAPQVGPGARAFREPAPASQRATTFAQLLRRIHDEVPGLQRLRFVTSYPRDFGDDVLTTMRECPRICRYLHAPAQSGSDVVLARMNRGYTVGEYRAFAARVFEHLPDACLAGDIIVGFPGETDEDFEATCALVRELPFKNNFIFKYSARPGTTAIDRFPDDIPDEVMRYRNNRLLAVQHETSARVHAAWVGQRVRVLFDQVRIAHAPAQMRASGAVPLMIGGQEVRHAGEGDLTEGAHLGETGANGMDGGAGHPLREPGSVQVVGRTPGDLIVSVPMPSREAAAARVGTIHDVKVVDSRPLLLIGSLELQ